MDTRNSQCGFLEYAINNYYELQIALLREWIMD